MSDADLARVREQVAQLPPRLRGPAAVAAGRGIAADTVIRNEAPRGTVSDGDLSGVPARWIVFAALQVLAAILAGASHLGGRGGRLDPEPAANTALIATVATVALGALALRLGPSMPMVLRSARRTPLLVALVLLPIGLVLGLVRLARGEAFDDGAMIRAAVVQVLGIVALVVILRRTPGQAAARAGAALSDGECSALRRHDPATAQRMKDAEIQALLALTALGQVDPQLAERESARIDERWGVGLVDGAS
ncbi:hypothetical protein OVN18_06425 [Microcella daejeonensis]|uniref:Uncharacterized protein n=1 Tax=Microcella daejeonensis TaxID=2994971 RepID=A0A9E8MNA1_9MICO|nr:hypothetical protein [Microcella daejeonensis]WAB82631.1 hypothetical protein OVN18_06425 [Microcella daejeonensis]